MNSASLGSILVGVHETRIVEDAVSAHLPSCWEELVAFESLYGQVYI